jgi:lipopolysaccharide/colanic/teichoic acid biosynthesis glycosyltransferase
MNVVRVLDIVLALVIVVLVLIVIIVVVLVIELACEEVDIAEVSRQRRASNSHAPNEIQLYEVSANAGSVRQTSWRAEGEARH